MRILWFNHRDPKHPEAGGAEVRIREIGRRLVRMGCSVKLVCEGWEGCRDVEFLDGIEIVRVFGRCGVHLSVPFLLNGGSEYDVVVDDMAHAVPWFSSLFTRKPVVGQVHHVHQEVLSVELPPFLARFVALSERSLRYLYKVLVVVSESTKRDLIAKFGVPADRIWVVPNGVDLDFYRPCRKSDVPTVLWVGRVKRYKRVEHVLLAFKIVKRSVPDARLFIVGRGDWLKNVEAFAGRIGVSDVVFTGWIGEREKVEIMGGSWVVVSASLVEGWGLNVLEAAACGTPTVAYGVAGLCDSVRDGVTGFLARNGDVRDLANKIIRVLGDEGLRERLSRNCLEYARRFSWDRTAEEFLRVLRLVVDEG